MSKSTPYTPNKASWRTASVAMVSLGVSVATSAAVFCTYFFLAKFLHMATYIPLLVGFIVVVGTPFVLQHKREVEYRASAVAFALATLSSVALYAFLVLLLILNIIGA